MPCRYPPARIATPFPMPVPASRNAILARFAPAWLSSITRGSKAAKKPIVEQNKAHRMDGRDFWLDGSPCCLITLDPEITRCRVMGTKKPGDALGKAGLGEAGSVYLRP